MEAARAGAEFAGAKWEAAEESLAVVRGTVGADAAAVDANAALVAFARSRWKARAGFTIPYFNL